jgi:uncharacterized protein YbjT (DUF2867 family)
MTRGYIVAIPMQLLENAMYAVTGITGQVGGAVANSLLEMGKKVRAVVRNPERARDWAAKGREIVQADFADSQALAGALYRRRRRLYPDSADVRSVAGFSRSARGHRYLACRS